MSNDRIRWQKELHDIRLEDVLPETIDYWIERETGFSFVSFPDPNSDQICSWSHEQFFGFSFSLLLAMSRLNVDDSRASKVTLAYLDRTVDFHLPETEVVAYALQLLNYCDAILSDPAIQYPNFGDAKCGYLLGLLFNSIHEYEREAGKKLVANGDRMTEQNKNKAKPLNKAETLRALKDARLDFPGPRDKTKAKERAAELLGCKSRHLHNEMKRLRIADADWLRV